MHRRVRNVQGLIPRGMDIFDLNRKAHLYICQAYMACEIHLI